MQIDIDFINCYELLNLEPSSTWDEIRASYKSLAQAWHPDRFPEGSDKHREAKQVFPEINNAFSALENYVRNRGIPPLLDQLVQESSPQQKGESDEPLNTNHKNTQTGNPSDDVNAYFNNKEDIFSDQSFGKAFHQNTHNDEPIRSKKFSQNPYQSLSEKKAERKQELLKNLYTYFGLILFLLTLGFIYTTWIKTPDFPNKTPAQESTQITDYPSYTPPSIAEVTKGVTQAVANEINKITDKPADLENLAPELSAAPELQKEWGSNTSSQRPSSRMVKSQRFTYGDSMTTVVNIQGPPTKMEKNRHYNTWHYDKSIIYFENGKVKEWIAHPNHPLATALSK